MSCCVCSLASPPPVATGCGCAGALGLAHVACKIRAAEETGLAPTPWIQCLTCSVDYGRGPIRSALAARFYELTSELALGDETSIEATLLRGIAARAHATALYDEGDEKGAAEVRAVCENADFLTAMMQSQAAAGGAGSDGGGAAGGAGDASSVMQLFVLGNELGAEIEEFETAERFGASAPLHRRMIDACTPILRSSALPPQQRAIVADLSQRHARGLGNALAAQGQHEEAGRILKALVEEQTASLGEAHEETLESRVVWAQAMAMAGGVRGRRDAHLALTHAMPHLVESEHWMLPRAQGLLRMVDDGESSQDGDAGAAVAPLVERSAAAGQSVQRRKKKGKRGKKKKGKKR